MSARRPSWHRSTEGSEPVDVRVTELDRHQSVLGPPILIEPGVRERWRCCGADHGLDGLAPQQDTRVVCVPVVFPQERLDDSAADRPTRQRRCQTRPRCEAAPKPIRKVGAIIVIAGVGVLDLGVDTETRPAEVSGGIRRELSCGFLQQTEPCVHADHAVGHDPFVDRSQRRGQIEGERMPLVCHPVSIASRGERAGQQAHVPRGSSMEETGKRATVTCTRATFEGVRPVTSRSCCSSTVASTKIEKTKNPSSSLTPSAQTSTVWPPGNVTSHLVGGPAANRTDRS